MGIKAIPRNANVLLAHPTPKLLYIALANRGKPAPKALLMRSLPANTLAVYSGYAPLRYGNAALNNRKAAIAKNEEPTIGMIQL